MSIITSMAQILKMEPQIRHYDNIIDNSSCEQN